MRHTVLTLNGGSSSIKFALYQPGVTLVRTLHGQIDRIGQDARNGAHLTFRRSGEAAAQSHAVDAADGPAAVASLLEWLESQHDFASIKAVGHRVVFGMLLSEPQPVTAELLATLQRLIPHDPEHLPLQLALMEALRQRHPALPQVACFDTAFHRSMPQVASMLPIPRRYQAAGVRRYGFHGLSYAYLMQQLTRLGDPAATTGRVILAHLGNGASLAAVRNGRSVDTSMGFTPTSGLVMSSRSGDLDPGLIGYLARTEQMSVPQFEEMVNHASGLLGVSETSGDMRDLLAHEVQDERAAEAIALFCYQVKKCIGAYSAVLGGVDTLVFAGGIGEHAATVRSRICEGLEFLGINIEESSNSRNAAVISAAASRVTVRVMQTDEAVVIATATCHILGISD
jgi:acetate kinase